MFQELKMGFQARAHVKRYKTSDELLGLQTKGEKLNRWACAQIVWVQQSLESSGSWSSKWDSDVSPKTLPPSYKSFMMNYNMQGMDKTIPELFAMLKDAEVEIKKEH